MIDRLFNRASLRLSLIGGVVLPLLLAVGGVSFFALQAIERQARLQMEEDVQLVARALQLPLGRALERGRTGTVDKALESAFNINRVYGVYIYDAGGALVSAAGTYELRSDEERLSDLAERGSQGEYEEIGGRSVYSYFVPLTSASGRVNGLLQVTRRASDIQQYLAGLRWKAGGFLLMTMLFLTVLVMYGHHRAIGQPLNHLSDTMAQVERGELESRARPQGPKEIASLGAALNTMLESITSARKEIVQRRRTQVKLERRLQWAEKLAAIGQLSAGIAHELGTPLSVIDGKAQRALRIDDLPGAVAGALESIREEVRRMEHIIRQLLDFGRRNAMEQRPISMDRLVHMVRDGLSQASREATVTVDVVENGPAPVVNVDPTLMERALANLVSNAVDAAREAVRISWYTDTDHVGFLVEDDGPGVDADVASRIFDPFFTTKDVGKGTGLGLAVVHGVVDEHGGRIEVERSALGGAQFRVALPRSLEASSEEA